MLNSNFADQVIRKAVGPSKTEVKYFKILMSGHIGERELIALRSSMGKNKAVRDMALNVVLTREINLDWEHCRKGIDFIRNQWLSPSGRERKHNPFNEEQKAILRNYKTFTLVGFHNAGRTPEYPYYLSIFRCYDMDGAYFDYYYDFAKVHIL